MTTEYTLANLGWQPFFQQQMNLDEWDLAVCARVIEHHRSEYELATETGRQTLTITPSIPALTVGDWILLQQNGRFLRTLERKSCFRRKAAGNKVAEQLIAANVDTAFILCSLNDDFNLNRIERYLSIVNDADAEPVVVLSKMDLCEDSGSLRAMVQQLDNLLCVEVINCQDTASVAALLPWCQIGRTIVLLGSSGAGKSTLTNTLLGEEIQATNTIREDDAKGRHTTTSRSLLAMPDGALILDTPGMREIQLADCEQGVSATFADIEQLAEQCRFGNCQHESEPGCSVKKAIDAGELDQRRLLNYRKLLREQALHGASLAERRANDRALSRFYSRVQKEATHIKRG